MENGGFKIQNWGWRAKDWEYAIKILGFHHATPTFNARVSLCPLSRITLFWGHCKALNFPLEDDSQLFPGLGYSWVSVVGGRGGFYSKFHAQSNYIVEVVLWLCCVVVVVATIWVSKETLGLQDISFKCGCLQYWFHHCVLGHLLFIFVYCVCSAQIY